jgi:hypothetical protein
MGMLTHRILLTALAAISTLTAEFARAEAWKCSSTRGFVCSEAGCVQGMPKISLAIDFSSKTLSRCDEKGCDDYPITVEAAGAFISAFYAPTAFFKAVSDGSSYMEVATLGLTTYTYFGRCQ